MNIVNEIVEFAKMEMRNNGGLTPRLFVISSNAIYSLPVDLGKDQSERVQTMTDIGIRLAKTGDIPDLEDLVFVSEAWMGPARTFPIMPSQDPDRKEALLVNALDPKTKKQTLRMFACVRDRKQAVVELKEISLPEGATAEGPLLPAFLSGFRLFQR
jgi:hypothetical protein